MSTTSLDPRISETVKEWTQAPYDLETRDAVQQLLDSGNFTELTDSFYKELEFGTGGLRGIMGVGTNRMNKYTLGKATQGFSNYLKKSFPNTHLKVAIAFDSRNNSATFAQLVAAVFSANGIQVYLFEQLRPTPQLSFAIRHLGCHAGVMLTASHNPKEYNGYKAYWNDGGQLVAPHDRNVIHEVNRIQQLQEIRFEAIEENIHRLAEDIDTIYLHQSAALSLRPEIVKQQTDLRIVFSPIHGTGITLVPRLLENWGFTEVYVVQSQATPDGNFPTVVYPNPEEEEAMSLAVAEGERLGADIVLATDPDADRVGLAIQNEKGDFQLLNGNQIGSLLVDYVLAAYTERNDIQKQDYIVKTIVTTDLISSIAVTYGVPCHEVLTGFKFIGELMTAQAGNGRFLVGGEESYGFLIGDLVRDKDAVISCAFIAEMAAYHKQQGKSLFDALLSLYVQHGYYKEKLISLTKKGKSGAEEISAMMKRLRAEPPRQLGGIRVTEIKDYLNGQSHNLETDEKQAIDLPQSDVLQFITVDGDVISARPSGTEPKIKFYCSVKQPLADRGEYEDVSKQLDEKIERIMASLIS